MQILIEVGENLEETLNKVLEKSALGYSFCKENPKFRIIHDCEELPIDQKITFEDYKKQIFLEKMYETLSRGFDPHE